MDGWRALDDKVQQSVLNVFEGHKNTIEYSQRTWVPSSTHFTHGNLQKVSSKVQSSAHIFLCCSYYEKQQDLARNHGDGITRWGDYERFRNSQSYHMH